MITSISNNIGIEQVSFKDYQTEKLTVLNGRFTVDSTSASWKAASEIVFRFSSLVMSKSALSAVYVIGTLPTDASDTVRRGTVLKSWIKNNCLHIEKTDYFDTKGPLTFIVANAYVTGGQRERVTKDGFVNTGLQNQASGTILTDKCLLVKEHYVSCIMTFQKFKGPDGSTDQAFDIVGMPDDVDIYLPIVYANIYTDDKGAALTEAHLEGRHLTCTNTQNRGYTENYTTFFQFFAVRDGE